MDTSKQRALIEQLAVDRWVNITDRRSIDKEFKKHYGNRKNVRPWHLSKNSHKKIKLRCPECRIIREVRFDSCMSPKFTGLCNFCRNSKMGKANKIDLVGHKFNGCLVNRDIGKRDKHGHVIYECLCFCGNLFEARSGDILSGNTRSCGCLSRKISKELMTQYNRDKGHFVKDDHTQEEIEEHMKKYGIYNSPKWKAKRQEILERDNNTCQKCGSQEKLHIHHIYSYFYYPDYVFEDEYLITLCESCHSKCHANYHAIPETFKTWFLS